MQNLIRESSEQYKNKLMVYRQSSQRENAIISIDMVQ